MRVCCLHVACELLNILSIRLYFSLCCYSTVQCKLFSVEIFDICRKTFLNCIASLSSYDNIMLENFYDWNEFQKTTKVCIIGDSHYKVYCMLYTQDTDIQ